jgi:cell division protein FtsB
MLKKQSNFSTDIESKEKRIKSLSKENQDKTSKIRDLTLELERANLDMSKSKTTTELQKKVPQ